MKVPISFISFACRLLISGTALIFTGCAAVPIREYPKLILGNWEIRTYGHAFQPDGTAIRFDPENGDIMEKGTWSLAGDKLSMDWEERERPLRQKVRIKFLSPDAWEWYSTKGRVWDATRIGELAP